MIRPAACGRRPHGTSWDDARSLTRAWSPGPSAPVPLREAVGAVLAEDVAAPGPVPHYDSSAMDGWAVAGAPPWRIGHAGPLGPGRAVPVVTGGLLPDGADAVLPTELGSERDGLVSGPAPEPGGHVRRAGEEASAGAVLASSGRRLTAADVAVLAIAGLDVVPARSRPRVACVLTGDEVVTAGRPEPGRVRDAFDPLLPLAIRRLGGDAPPPVRLGDDPEAIRSAVAAADADAVVTVGGTGRSGADRLREALRGAETVFDGVAMRPGHPALLARLPDGRPLLGLPGNPLAAVAVLLSFLPPLVDGLTAAEPAAEETATAAVAMPGWQGGTALVPCAVSPRGLLPAAATRSHMLRGLAASSVLAVVPPAGVAPGSGVRALPLPW
jgi:molybdopterin molybdotransferase